MVVLVAIALVLLVRGWLGGDGSSAGGSGGRQGAVDGRIEAPLGQTVKLGEVSVVVSALAPTSRVAVPGQVVRPGPPLGAAEGRFFQAYVRVHNAGARPVRVDPWDFSLLTGAGTTPIDPALSGPPSRSLLPGASLDLILAFRAAPDEEPRLRYAAPWFEGELVTTGVRAPAGVLTGSTQATR